MENFRVQKADFGDWLMDFFGLQIWILLGLWSLTVWLWPEGVLDAPVSMIPLTDWLWIAGALVVGFFAVLSSYFSLVEPVADLVRRRKWWVMSR
jgi:hypothetical protein